MYFICVILGQKEEDQKLTTSSDTSQGIQVCWGGRSCPTVAYLRAVLYGRGVCGCGDTGAATGVPR